MECLNSKSACELINRILPGSRLLISSLPDLALKTHVELLDKPCDVKKKSVLKAMPGKLHIKRHSPWYSLFTSHLAIVI